MENSAIRNGAGGLQVPAPILAHGSMGKITFIIYGQRGKVPA